MRNETSGTWVGVSLGATSGSSERRKATMERMSSSEACGSLGMYGGAYRPSRLTPVRSRYTISPSVHDAMPRVSWRVMFAE